MSHEFRDPKLAINKVYTRQGDAGETRLVGGQTIHKSHIRLETYGTVDELNGHVGLAIEFACSELAEPHKSQLSTLLRRIQHELFNLGSVLATLPEDVGPQQPKVTTYDIERLEREMDEMGAALPHFALSFCPEVPLPALNFTSAEPFAAEPNDSLLRGRNKTILMRLATSIG